MTPQELKKLIGPDTPLEDLQQHKFNLYRSHLKNNMAWMVDRTPDDLALDTISELAKLLRTGKPCRETLDLLAKFLEDELQNSSESDKARKKATDLAFRVLGLSPGNGRPRKDMETQRAIAEFETYISKGLGQEAAERAAYDAYYATETRSYKEGAKSERRTYAKDSARLCTRTIGAKTVQSNEAERAMCSTIRPLL